MCGDVHSTTRSDVNPQPRKSRGRITTSLRLPVDFAVPADDSGSSEGGMTIHRSPPGPVWSDADGHLTASKRPSDYLNGAACPRCDRSRYTADQEPLKPAVATSPEEDAVCAPPLCLLNEGVGRPPFEDDG